MWKQCLLSRLYFFYSYFTGSSVNTKSCTKCGKWHVNFISKHITSMTTVHNMKATYADMGRAYPVRALATRSNIGYLGVLECWVGQRNWLSAMLHHWWLALPQISSLSMAWAMCVCLCIFCLPHCSVDRWLQQTIRWRTSLWKAASMKITGGKTLPKETINLLHI